MGFKSTIRVLNATSCNRFGVRNANKSLLFFGFATKLRGVDPILIKTKNSKNNLYIPLKWVGSDEQTPSKLKLS